MHSVSDRGLSVAGSGHYGARRCSGGEIVHTFERFRTRAAHCAYAPQVSTWSPAPAPSAGRRPAGHLWFLLLPILSVGTASFALPLWAAARTAQVRPAPAVPSLFSPLDQEPARIDLPREALFGIAAALGAGTALAVLLDVTLLRLALLAAGVALALRWRGALFPPVVSQHIALLNAQQVPDAVTRAQARRAVRQQYRDLVARDPALAREIGVGRPHLPRDLDDGGLLDLNSVPAATLVERAELTPEQAEHVVALRHRRHGLTSVDELVVHGDLPPSAVDRLREYAVFLPV